ncbi:hypothetical protein QE386_001115 [Pseudoxanthomonas winnipegensis]|nr:hypothetical protein [Pseudoxanthomonas winnipegensis]
MQMTVGRHQPGRRGQRDIAGRVDRAFGRHPGLARAQQGLHRAGTQVDAADQVVAGVGHVELIAQQRHVGGAAEAGDLHVAVQRVGVAVAEAPHHAPGMGALDDLMMTGVGHVQTLGIDRKAGGETQRQARLGMGLDRARVDQRLVQRLAQRGELVFQRADTGRADDVVDHHALRVDQHDGRPGLDAEALPGVPVQIVRDRETDPEAAQALERGLRIAVHVETRHGDHPHLQARAEAALQQRQIGQPLQAPARGRVDEGQRHRAATQRLQRGRRGVEPQQTVREVGSVDRIHEY